MEATKIVLTRARMNNFYKYHDHWGKAIQKEKRGRRIIFGHHLMLLNVDRLCHDSFNICYHIGLDVDI